ncbi:hypothetical protein BHM03_00023667 [Ensete ventricosum]|nr:hypothetical protein BHM03_00023667 [Ensete ventricosum]
MEINPGCEEGFPGKRIGASEVNEEDIWESPRVTVKEKAREMTVLKLPKKWAVVRASRLKSTLRCSECASSCASYNWHKIGASTRQGRTIEAEEGRSRGREHQTRAHPGVARNQYSSYGNCRSKRAREYQVVAGDEDNRSHACGSRSEWERRPPEPLIDGRVLWQEREATAEILPHYRPASVLTWGRRSRVEEDDGLQFWLQIEQALRCSGCASSCTLLYDGDLLTMASAEAAVGRPTGIESVVADGTIERGRRIGCQRKRRRRTENPAIAGIDEDWSTTNQNPCRCLWGGRVPWWTSAAYFVGDVHEFSSSNACQRMSRLLRRGAITGGIEGADTVETGRVNRLATSATARRQSNGSS